MPAPLHLEMAESHLVQSEDFRCIQTQYAVLRVRQHQRHILAAVRRLTFLKRRGIIAQKGERTLRERFVVQRPQRTVADAIFVDQ